MTRAWKKSEQDASRGVECEGRNHGHGIWSEGDSEAPGLRLSPYAIHYLFSLHVSHLSSEHLLST